MEPSVILHIDVVGSTALLQRNGSKAHERNLDRFRRFSEMIQGYGGMAREMRGDALVAEFARASDAVTAAIAFQTDNTNSIDQSNDDFQVELRLGISLDEVILADDTITGGGVVAIAFAEMGREQEARNAIEDLLRIDPNYTLATFTKSQPFRDTEVLDRHIDGLQKAGFPA